MKRFALVIAGLLTLYLSSGFYIVKGNEKALVRRFGKVLSTKYGGVRLRGSGLHYELPWPWATINRVNLNEVRMLTVGSAEFDDFTDTGFLQAAGLNSRSQFLTGDKNILNLQISVQYHISEQHVVDFLFASKFAEQHLEFLVESSAADLISRSGVDFVHPLGLGELRNMLTVRVRQLAAEHRLGIEVEDVTINAVYPPVRVKKDFLDVSDARADKQKYINAALVYEEQRLATARAESQKIIDEAEIYRQQSVEAARGKADSFTIIVNQFQLEQRHGIQTYAAARQMAMRRLYLETMEEVFRKVAGKVWLDSGKSTDLTIFRDTKQ